MIAKIFTVALVTLCGLSTVHCLVDPEDLIKQFGYPAETHYVITDDGYNLTLHRVPYGVKNDTKEGRIPVYIMHGMGASSAMFVDLGPERNLGFLLADAGYDVWIANARGNSYSNRHLTINPDENSALFYNYSWHEIGTIDLPNSIDYILNLTNQKSLHYIGHSQGGTSFYVMASSLPEYNQKIRLASLMGPAGIMKNIPEILLKLLVQFMDYLELLPDLLNLHHLPYMELLRNILKDICSMENSDELCNFFFDLAGGYDDYEQLNTTILPIVFGHCPSDVAIRQALHYGQNVRVGLFQQYDYGKEGNQIKYGSDTPPQYNLSAITAPVALYYGKNDRFVSPIDVEALGNIIPNWVHDGLSKHEKLNHGGFVYATDIVDILYNELMSVMSEYNN